MKTFSVILFLIVFAFGVEEELKPTANDFSFIDDSEIELIDDSEIELIDDSEIELIDDSEMASYEEESEFYGVDVMPTLKTFINAHYPEHLLREGVEGTVLLELLIDESGLVESVEVVAGADPDFDSSAVRAARDFEFTPAQVQGESVAVLLQYEYHFTLHEAQIELQEVRNFEGRLIERGTRIPVQDAFIVLNFTDTLCDGSLPLPLQHYLERIASFEGQYIEENRLVTVSDSSGRFSFYSLPSCSVEISVIVPGYREFSTKEFISEGELIDAVYHVTRHSYSDFEILVYGRVEEKEVSRRQLTLAEVRKIPGLGGDAIKVVQAMPGVARPRMGSSEIVVRGAPSWDSRYYLDGVPIPLLFHFGGLTSIYNAEALESIDFYPGGFGTRYGGVIGGVVEIKGRKAETERWKGHLDVSSIDASVFAEGPVSDNVSVQLYANRSYVGELLNFLIDIMEKSGDFEFPISLAPYYWDYLVRTDIDLNSQNQMYFSLLGSLDSVVLAYSEMADMGSSEIDDLTDHMSLGISFHQATFNWDHIFSEMLRNSLTLSGTMGRFNSSVFGIVKANEKFRMFNLRDELNYTPNDRFRFNLGVDLELIVTDLELTIPQGNQSFARDTTNDWLFGLVGTYLNMEFKPIENLLIIPGIRYDYYPELDYRGGIVPEFWPYDFMNNRRGKSGEPSFRLTGRYEFIPGNTIKAAIGTYSQTPQPVGQVIHPTWGNPALPATKASHYVAGYERHLTDLLSLDVQGYYNYQWDVPRMAGQGDMEDRDSEQALWTRDGTGRMYGLELMLRHDRSERFFGWLTYTLSRSEYFSTVDNKWALFSTDETHNIQLLASWHLDRDWDLGFRLRYVTGKPYTPIVNRGESENWKGFFPIYGDTNSGRYNPFFQLDLRADKKIIFNNFIYSFYVDLQNISWFLYKSPEQYFYNYNYTERQSISMIPMLRTGVKVEF
ncbi:TonB family protein [Chitinispirillum alkaliphilum]|nr:TonB family protein [Chitinispirillum alkaliphilum]